MATIDGIEVTYRLSWWRALIVIMFGLIERGAKKVQFWAADVRYKHSGARLR